MNTHPKTITSSAPQRSIASLIRDLIALFKLRVVLLLLFASVAGAFVGAGEWPGVRPLVLLLIAGGVTSAGASAINQYLEMESDARMQRTQQRPLVTGTVARPGWILIVGSVMAVAPALLVLPGNPSLSFFLILGAVIYVGVYTIWLKPRTPLNIVIGGTAGSCTVLSGGAAVGAWTDPGVLTLALLVFLWTPIHFWSLALAYKDDYERAGVPMLPVRTTPRRSALWSALHSLVGGVTGLALNLHSSLGLLYLIPTFIATLYLWGASGRLIVQPTQQRAWQTFHISNFYLALILLFACLDAGVL
ncbi:MAG: protoheme IX farnesyltransferase [Chloroflexi bacterium]|nr:protoheme IX farnesyltransferase [Chloroflexota bacterium]